MFRPSVGPDHPHAQRHPFPTPPQGMQNPSYQQFRPPFVMLGRGSPPGQVGAPRPGFPTGQPQQFPRPYPGFHGQPSRGPPPLPGSPPMEVLPPRIPPVAEQSAPTGEAPQMPRDPEMLKNIDILSSFVVKNGSDFENLARQKQAGDPKFGFLFGGEPGSDAAIGRAYYEWKKNALLLTFRPQHSESQAPQLPQQSPLMGKADVFSPINGAPVSPAGSDMDMEDDFTAPSALERNVELPEEPRSLPMSALPEQKPNIPANTDAIRPWPPQGGQDPRVPTSFNKPSQLNPPSAPTAILQASEKGRAQSVNASADHPKRRDTRRRTGFDRACMEDVTPSSSPPRPSAPQPRPERVPDPVFVQDKKPSLAGKGHRAEGAPRATQWGAREPSPLQEFPESASPSIDSPKVSERLSDKYLEMQQRDKVSERSSESESERFSGREPERIEAVTPRREDDSEEDMKEDVDLSSKEKLMRDEDRKFKDSDTAKEGRTASGSELGAPSVDEFGRLIRQGGSDSDGDITPHGRKRRRSASRSRSRSRSRSAGDNQWRRQSRSQSPRRWSRHSRTRSRTPRRNRSRSRSPPTRDSRWGGDSGRWGDRGFQDRGDRSYQDRGDRGFQDRGDHSYQDRGDRGYPDRSDRGGRRGGRGDRGAQSCNDFAKGRCFRGANCRFLHLDNANGMSADQGGSRYERGGGRASWGRRENSEEIDRWERGSGRGGRGRTSGRSRRPWEASNDRDEDYEEERRKPSEERRKPWEERRKPSEERRKPWEERRKHSEERRKPSEERRKPSEERRKPSEERRKPSAERERQRPDGTPVRDYVGREEETDEKPQPLESLAAGTLATSHQSNFSSIPPLPALPSSSSLSSFPDFPPPPPELQQLHSTFTANLTNLASAASHPATPLSQGFSAPPYNVNLAGQGYTPTMMMHAGFSGNLAPPQGAYPSRLPAMQLQPTYVVTSPQQPGYPPVSQVSSGHPTILVRPVPLGGPPQIGVQSIPAPTRPESTWPMSFSMQPVQIAQQPQSYSFPPPPPPPAAGYSSNLGAYQYSQQQQQPPVSKPMQQYSSLADSLEPQPPGAKDAEAKPQAKDSTVPRHIEDQWKGNSGGNGTQTHMGHVGMVILESVSPGLPGHHHMENVSPGPHAGLVMESVSPATVVLTSKSAMPSHQGAGASTFGSSLRGEDQGVALENVSPAPNENRNWSPTGAGEAEKEESNKGHTHKGKRDKEGKHGKEGRDKEGRGLTFLRTAVAEHVKEVLKPTWREGHMSKEAFKTIAKKAVDKVLGAIQPHQVPRTQEKVDVYMVSSRPKISKLVQGYVDKYVKT